MRPWDRSSSPCWMATRRSRFSRTARFAGCYATRLETKHVVPQLSHTCLRKRKTIEKHFKRSMWHTRYSGNVGNVTKYVCLKTSLSHPHRNLWVCLLLRLIDLTISTVFYLVVYIWKSCAVLKIHFCSFITFHTQPMVVSLFFSLYDPYVPCYLYP